MAHEISIEIAGEKDTGVCKCCGRRSRRVWGYTYADGRCTSAYFVNWTMGHVADLGANIDLIVGDWGEESIAADRWAIALEYKILESGPSVAVIDAKTRPFSRSELIGHVLSREQVIGTQFSDDAFAITDAILAQDDRVTELLGNWVIAT